MKFINRLKNRVSLWLEPKAKAFLEIKHDYKFHAKTVVMPEKYTRFNVPEIDMDIIPLMAITEVSLMDARRLGDGFGVDMRELVDASLSRDLGNEVLKYCDRSVMDNPETFKRTFSARLFVAKRKGAGK